MTGGAVRSTTGDRSAAAGGGWVGAGTEAAAGAEVSAGGGVAGFVSATRVAGFGVRLAVDC